MNALSQSAPSVWSRVSNPTPRTWRSAGRGFSRKASVLRENLVAGRPVAGATLLRRAKTRRFYTPAWPPLPLSPPSRSLARCVPVRFPAGFRRRRRRSHSRRACRRARRRRSLSHRPAWLRESARRGLSPRRASLDPPTAFASSTRASVARSRDRHARRSTDGTQRREPPRSAPTLVDVQRRHHHHPIIRRPSQVRASPPPARLAAASWRPRPPPSTPPPTALSPAR